MTGLPTHATQAQMILQRSSSNRAQPGCHNALLQAIVINRALPMCHRWEASNGNPGVGDLYLSVMDALDAIDDRAIYFIEGAGQQNFVTAWGDGFVTDAAIISQHGLSDPRPFFNALLKKACVNRVRTSIIMHPVRQNCTSI